MYERFVVGEGEKEVRDTASGEEVVSIQDWCAYITELTGVEIPLEVGFHCREGQRLPATYGDAFARGVIQQVGAERPETGVELAALRPSAVMRAQCRVRAGAGGP